MSPNRVLASLFLASLSALAQTPLPPAGADYRAVSRKADAILRKENGTRLELDDIMVSGTRFQKATNRVYWNSSTKDQRLVSIVVEPLAAEDETTSTLTAALLVSVSAVDSLEEGLRIAGLVKQAQESDGQSRVITLGNGVKLYRLKSENKPAKFQIRL
jgi:hypothetical protein